MLLTARKEALEGDCPFLKKDQGPGVHMGSSEPRHPGFARLADRPESVSW
jgi:hypothetical protein